MPAAVRACRARIHARIPSAMIGPPDRMVDRPARHRSEGSVVELIVKIVVNAIALFVAVQVLPSSLLSFNFGNDWWKLVAVALVFALVNSYIKPIVKALSMPIGLLTMGIVAFVINAAMLLIVAFVSGQLKLGFKVGDFPPDLLSSDTIVGAIVAALIISIVSTIASIVLTPRKLI
jgi:putative membrane protein